MTETLPSSSSYMLNADAQAILEEAPSLDVGLEMLAYSYNAKQWDDPEDARKTTAQYATYLRQRFEDSPSYPLQEVPTRAPLSLSEFQGEGETPEDQRVDQINKWEAGNTDFIKRVPDSSYIVDQDKLIKSVSDYASHMRRNEEGKNASWWEDKFYRAAEGMTGGIAKLVGAEDYVKNLNEHTDPDRDQDLFSDLASGAGMIGGALAAGAVSAGYGVIPYFVASGAGEVRERYKESLEQTGDSGRATIAAAIEAGNQGIQIAAGSKIVRGTAKRIARRLLGKEVAEVAGGALQHIEKSALTMAGAAGASRVVSNVAQKYGAHEEITNIQEGADRAMTIGLIFGAGAGGADALLRSKPESPATDVPKPVKKIEKGHVVDEETTATIKGNTPVTDDSPVVQTLDPHFTTAEGQVHTVAQDGTVSTVGVEGTSYFPPDKTVFVDAETAYKLGAIKRAIETKQINADIATDGQKLIIRSDQVADDLSISDTRGQMRDVILEPPSAPEAGSHPVGLYRPKNLNGNSVLYRLPEIGEKITDISPEAASHYDSQARSVGAMALGETKERSFSKRVRLNEEVDAEVRNAFGDEETGLDRYWVQHHEETISKAENTISQLGPKEALRQFFETDADSDMATSVRVGQQLFEDSGKALSAARKAGDTQAVEQAVGIQDRIANHLARLGTMMGQGIEAFKLWMQGGPERRLYKMRVDLGNAARIEVAKGLGTTVKDIDSLDTQIKNVDNQIKTVESQAPTVKTTTPEGILKETKEATPAQKEIISALNKEKTRLTNRKQNVDKAVSERIEKNLTPEIEKEMRDLYDAVPLTWGSQQQQLFGRLVELEDKVLTGGKVKLDSDFWYTRFMLNLVSGLSTQAVNVEGNTLMFASAAYSHLMTGLMQGNFDGASFFTSALKAARGEGFAAFKEEMKGRQTFRAGRDIESQGSITKLVPRRPDFVKSATPFEKKTGLANLGYAFRSLSAADANFYKANYEGAVTHAAHIVAREQGLKGEALKEKVSNMLFNTKANWEEAMTKARKGAETLERLGIKQDENAIKLAAWEYLDSKRPEELRIVGQNLASKYVYANVPEGFIGRIVKGLEHIAYSKLQFGGKTFRPIRYQIPFLRIGGNLLNAYLDHDPLIGTVRAVNKFWEHKTNLADLSANQGEYAKLKQSLESGQTVTYSQLREQLRESKAAGAKDVPTLKEEIARRKAEGTLVSDTALEDLQGKLTKEKAKDIQLNLEKHNQVGKALLGYSLLGTLFGLSQLYKDDPDPWFDVYAEGPPPGGEQENFKSAGGKRYSIKIGKSFIRFAETPFAMALAPLGVFRDMQRTGKKINQQSAYDTVAAIVAGTGNAVLDNGFLKSTADLITAVKDGAKANKISNLLDATALNYLKNMVPGAAILRDITRFIHDPLDTSRGDLWTKLISGIPFAQSVGTKPALDAFGEPIERTLYDRLSFIGRFYSQKVTDPAWRWLIENDYTVTKTGLTVQLADAKKPSVKERRKMMEGEAFEEILTPEERYKFVETAGPLIKQKVMEYAQRYGGSGHQDKVQERLTRDIGRIKSRVKFDLFIRNNGAGY